MAAYITFNPGISVTETRRVYCAVYSACSRVTRKYA